MTGNHKTIVFYYNVNPDSDTLVKASIRIHVPRPSLVQGVLAHRDKRGGRSFARYCLARILRGEVGYQYRRAQRERWGDACLARCRANVDELLPGADAFETHRQRRHHHADAPQGRFLLHAQAVVRRISEQLDGTLARASEAGDTA